VGSESELDDEDDDVAWGEKPEQVIDEDGTYPAIELLTDIDPQEREQEFKEFAKTIGNKKNLETLNSSQKEQFKTLARLSTKVAIYGQPVDRQALKELEDDSGGLIWRAKIFRTGYTNKKISNPDGTLKARRPVPIVFEEDFFRSLSCSNGKYVFQGRLNGWPGLTNLELISLDYLYSRGLGRSRKLFSKQFWSNKSNSKRENTPRYPIPGSWFFKQKPICIRATLRAPKYTEFGYSKDNPGHAYWFKPFRSVPGPDGGPKIAHGMNIMKALEHDHELTGEPMPRAVKAHFYAHRYAKVNERPKDKIMYHTGVLLEWDHGRYCTNVELAYRHGLGGYGGRSNWIEDRDSGRPLLWACLQDNMKCPWRTKLSEVRMIDMNVKNLDEFRQFLKKYEGPRERFLKPHIKYSLPVRLSMNSAVDIARYVINYSLRDPSYSEEFHSCQSFASDFVGFLCAKTVIEPLFPAKLLYKERRHLFLYDFDKFEKHTRSTRKKKKSPSEKSNHSSRVVRPNVIKKLFS